MTPSNLPIPYNPFSGKLTCQVCEGRFLAREGLIGRHGHVVVKSIGTTRGYASDGCWGSRELPFEIDRHILRQWIDYRKSLQDNLAPNHDPEAVAMLDAEIEQLEARYEAWTPTIDASAWHDNRERVMGQKRSSATAKGWVSRRRNQQQAE